MIKRNMAILFILYFSLASCNPTPSQVVTPQSSMPSASPAISEINNLRPPYHVRTTPTTQTQYPELTVTPTFSFTFIPSQNKTVTPEKPNTCRVDPSQPLGFHFPRTGYEASINWDSDNMIRYDQEILSYLTNGGDIENVRRDLDLTYQSDYYYLDVTNDGGKDLVMQGFTIFGTILVYYCQDGEWHLFTPDTRDGDHLSAIQDINSNGIPEIVDDACSSSGSGCQSLNIYEWDGQGFKDLSDGRVGIAFGPAGRPTFRDYNGDGLREIIVKGGYCGWGIMTMCFPWRLETLIFSWDGSMYTLLREEFTPPEYRYQAVQDADREFLYHNYSKALDLYTAAIEDKTLDWWSQARGDFEIYKWNHRMDDPLVLPTPPSPDPDEYGHLAAYSKYRIGLLYLVTGHQDLARSVFENLALQYPKDTPGYTFTEIAGVFWGTYQESGELTGACQAVIAFVSQFPERLEFLDGTNHLQDHHYLPEDICPVTNEWIGH